VTQGQERTCCLHEFPARKTHEDRCECCARGRYVVFQIAEVAVPGGICSRKSYGCSTDCDQDRLQPRNGDGRVHHHGGTSVSG
jgi:hypothetical protein